MKLEGGKVLLRIFIDTFQKWHHRPVYEVLVERARAEGLAGATVLAALEGYGPNGHVLRDGPWHLSNDRQVTVEVVDTAERIEGFLCAVEPMLVNAVVTLERARVALCRGAEET